MCNRYRQLRTRANLSLICDARPIFDDELPAGDVYPSSRKTKRLAAIVRKEEGARVLDALPWGIPASIKTPTGSKLNFVTNVRNLSSPFWKSAIANRASRCLVPFSSFAEPKPGMGDDGRPACWWFDLPASEVAAFAGIWRPYSREHKGETIAGVGFAFLACEPNPLVAPKHPKAMQVILQLDDYQAWLDGDYADASALAQPLPSQLMRVDEPLHRSPVRRGLRVRVRRDQRRLCVHGDPASARSAGAGHFPVPCRERDRRRHIPLRRRHPRPPVRDQRPRARRKLRRRSHCPDETAEAARDMLQSHALGRRLSCRRAGSSFERVVAWCADENARDLSCSMIGTGTAVRWPRHDPDGRLREC